MTLRVISALLVLLMATACAPTGQQGRNADANRFAPITLRVSGYGTYEDATKDRLDTRKRLMARRASQLDAYRNLAERVYGTVVYGGATVNDFVLQNDDFRAYVDSYLRGMKTVSVNEHSDGVVETVVELKLEPRFRQCVASVPDTQVARYCSLPLPRENDSAGDVRSGNTDSLYYLD
jgi:hypothetical protein